MNISVWYIFNLECVRYLFLFNNIKRSPPLSIVKRLGSGGPFKGERKSKDKVEVGGRGGEICEPEDRFNESKDREV